MHIRYEKLPEGYRVYDGPLLVGILYTSHHRGAIKDGQVLYEPMPRDSWNIHWTSPQVSLPLLEAVLQGLPADA